MKKILVLVMVLMIGLYGCDEPYTMPSDKVGNTELLERLDSLEWKIGVELKVIGGLYEDTLYILDTIEKQTHDFDLNTCLGIDDDETYVREDCYYDLDGVIDAFNDMHGWIEIDDRGYVVIFANLYKHDMFYLYDYDGVPRSAIPLEKWIVEDKTGIGGRYPIQDDEIESAINQWEKRNMPVLMEAYLKTKEEN